jgi:hypothetical protein
MLNSAPNEHTHVRTENCELNGQSQHYSVLVEIQLLFLQHNYNILMYYVLQSDSRRYYLFVAIIRYPLSLSSTTTCNTTYY